MRWGTRERRPALLRLCGISHIPALSVGHFLFLFSQGPSTTIRRITSLALRQHHCAFAHDIADPPDEFSVKTSFAATESCGVAEGSIIHWQGPVESVLFCKLKVSVISAHRPLPGDKVDRWSR